MSYDIPLMSDVVINHQDYIIQNADIGAVKALLLKTETSILSD